MNDLYLISVFPVLILFIYASIGTVTDVENSPKEIIRELFNSFLHSLGMGVIIFMILKAILVFLLLTSGALWAASIVLTVILIFIDYKLFELTEK